MLSLRMLGIQNFQKPKPNDNILAMAQLNYNKYYGLLICSKHNFVGFEIKLGA